jgi:hypothetical protein
METLLPGDLIFTRGNGFLQKAIRWATRMKGECPTKINHTAGVVSSWEMCEALWRVRVTGFSSLLKRNFEVWEPLFLIPEERFKIAKIARSYEGRYYGWPKIIAHLGDAFINKVSTKEKFFFRKLAMMDRYPICSWVWGWAYYNAIGYTFEIDPAYADPDHQHDWVVSQPHAWRKRDTTQVRNYISSII